MINNFLAHLEIEKNYSQHTINAYRTDLHQFKKFIFKEFNEVTRYDVLNFLKFLKIQGFNPSTANRKLAAIKSFYKFLMIEGIADINPAELIESAKLEATLPRIITIEEYEHLISIIDNLEDRTLIELLFTTGLRREEVVSLKRTNFISDTLKINGKGKKDRIIPLISEIMPNTVLWLKQHNSKWIFPSSVNKGKPNTTRWANDVIRKWADKVGYFDITPHSFRHAFGTYLYENGADIKSIQDMMGHESTDTTNIYAQVSVKRNRKELMKAHPLIKRPE